MFEGLTRSKFLKHCNSSLDSILIRIEGIKRKRNAIKKCLKNDIADLLKSGFDRNAYGRAEGLLNEINMITRYGLAEQFCKVILDHLSMMNKQKECPEQCKEAVASLMFATARFADLPELRELRTLFDGKYGKSLESHVNQEFEEKLKMKHPTKDEKLRLLHDVATEFEIKWEPKALEQELYKPPKSEQVQSKSSHDTDINIKKTENKPAREKDKQNLETNNPSIEKSDENFIKEKAQDSKPKSKAGDSRTSSGNHSEDDSKPKSVRKTNLKPPPGREKAEINEIGTENKDPGLKVRFEEENIEKKDGSHSGTTFLEEGSTSEKKKGHAHPKKLDYDDFVTKMTTVNQKN